MKIFPRSAEKEKADAKPTASKPTGLAPGPAAPAPQGPAAASAAPPPAAGAAAAPPAPPAPPAPDVTAIIDANVKEMSEKIARLATTIEGDKGERADFESKLERMEERMRKLSALTEMISAQYNPFVGAAPSEREPMPQPEVGLAAPAVAPSPPPQAPAHSAAPPPPPAATAVSLALEDPLASVASALAPPLPEPEPPFAEAHDIAPGPAPEEEPALMLEAPPEGGAPARLWSVRPGFGSSMLMLSWADMLLKNAPDRDAFVQLLDYYQNLAWIGAPARDQLLAYADGIRKDSDTGTGTPADWRASLEVHEKSLLFIEKLRAIQGD